MISFYDLILILHRMSLCALSRHMSICALSRHSYFIIRHCVTYHVTHTSFHIIIYLVTSNWHNHYMCKKYIKDEEIIEDWLNYLLFYVPLKNISLVWRRHHYRWWAAKFRPMLGAQGLWAGRDLYRATLAVTRGLGFSGLIRWTAPFIRLLRHIKGYGESI
jgi:hypothetical protein